MGASLAARAQPQLVRYPLAFVGLGLACLVGGALRVAYAFQGGLWRDEAEALGIATIPSAQAMVEYLIHHESHPPAYYLLLRGWISVFGGSDAAAIALPLLFGIALIPASFFVTRSLHSARAGVLAAILVSVHPGLILFAGTVRPYSLLSFLATCLVLFLWRILRQPNRTSSLLGYPALASLMVYTHHWAWLVVAASGVLWLVIGIPTRGFKELRAIAMVHALIAVAYAPWVRPVLHQLNGAGHLPVDASVGQVASWSVFAITWLPSTVAAVLLAVSLGLFLVRSRARSPSDAGLAVVLAAGIPSLSALMTVALVPVANMTSLWCYSIVAPLCVVAIALLTGQREIGRRALPTAAIQVTWVTVMLLTWGQMYSAPRADTKEIAKLIRASLKPTDRVVVVPGYLVPSFQRYFMGRDRVYSLPDDGLAAYIPYDHRMARDLDPRAWIRLLGVIDSSRSDCDRVWLVVESGTPPHMERLVSHLLAQANLRLGPPVLVESSLLRTGAIEHSSVRQYDPCTARRAMGSGKEPMNPSPSQP